MGKINVTAHAENITLTFNMQKEDLEVLRGILNLAEEKLRDYSNVTIFGGLSEQGREQMEKSDTLIAMIRGAILRY